MDINLLIGGFPSTLVQKPPSTPSIPIGSEHNSVGMIDQMREAGIGVYNNDSWNPWLRRITFFGGIGIESRFRTLLSYEMESVQA